MKIIDKTPLLNEKGELGLSQRLQAVAQYGFTWLNELQAQKAIITYFDRQLEKGYTLIRNLALGRSGITVPIILLGPAGIYVIHVAYLRGRYEARGEAWNAAAGEGYKPAPVNLVQHTRRMARAVKAFIERQGVRLPVDIEAVMIGGDPGLHIEAVRPAVRVLMIDGVKSFVSSLAAAQPVLSPEQVYELTERLLNPHPPRKTRAAAAPAPGQPVDETPPREVSRARAIFDASQDARPFDPADFDFAMLDEEPGLETGAPEAVPAGSPPQEAARPVTRRRRRVLGMTPGQVAVLAGLALAFLCILAGFAYYVFVLS